MPNCFKRNLTKTEVGESRTHRSGIRPSRQDALRLFPKPLGRKPYSFDYKDDSGNLWKFEYTYRKSKPRIWQIEKYLRSYSIRAGDEITLCAPEAQGETYRISFAKNALLPGEEDLRGYAEGDSMSIKVNRYERDSRNRKKAISKHGVRCFGCCREMAEIYGEIAKDFIHIHHVKLISESVPTEPSIDDLVPLCPNCHAIVHLKNPPLSISKLKGLIRQQREEQ